MKQGFIDRFFWVFSRIATSQPLDLHKFHRQFWNKSYTSNSDSRNLGILRRPENALFQPLPLQKRAKLINLCDFLVFCQTFDVSP